MTLKSLLPARQIATLPILFLVLSTALLSLLSVAQTDTISVSTTRVPQQLTAFATAKMARTIPARRTVSEGETCTVVGATGADEQVNYS